MTYLAQIPSRRQLLASAGAAAAAMAASRLSLGQQAARPRVEPPALPEVEKADRPMNILILGGTGFIGPFEVQHARARGHKVTIANRGRSRPEMYEGIDIEHIEYDRDQEPTALIEAAKSGRKWDAVIDNVGYTPTQTAAAAGALKDAVNQYIFISSVSVYKMGAEGASEDSPKETVTDEQAESATMQDVGRWYGALKHRCELKAAESMGAERTTAVRPGLIVGPWDYSDRFTYWPARVMLEDRCGGEMLVPGSEEEPMPIQVIDVRDLAAFLVTLVESGATGDYNAVGPTEKLEDVVEAAKAHAKVNTRFVYVPTAFLAENQVGFFAELPAVIPPTGETAGFARTNIDRALAAGLDPRPISETTQATIDWWKTLPQERRDRLWSERSPAMKEQREQALLDKWKQQQA